MSQNGNGYGWKKRQAITVTCPSGQKVVVKRPGPDFYLRSGRVSRTFTLALTTEKDAPALEAPIEEKRKFWEGKIERMSDDELAALLMFAKDLIVTMVISPRIVLEASDDDEDTITPEDIGNDFWFLFAYGMANFVGIKVPVGAPGAESEVKVSDLETFRTESSVSGDSVDGVHVSADA